MAKNFLHSGIFSWKPKQSEAAPQKGGSMYYAMRYEIIDQGETINVFGSFSQAVAYARENAWVIYDREAKRIIYDGETDEFYL